MKILLTGGAGYIGTHTAVALVEAGHDPVIVDDLSNSSEEAVRRVRELTGRQVPFHELDLRQQDALTAILREEGIEAVIHLAGLKAVGESVAQPLRYYGTNLESTLSLLEAMRASGVERIVFSSTATVYGAHATPPFRESDQAGVDVSHPYGKTKFMIEQILADAAAADPALQATVLRYFNPIGAHPSGRIGEDPAQIPNNLAPFVLQVAVGKLPLVRVFGNDYDTPDGTGLRDYLHVMDLAEGHVAALDRLEPGSRVYNLGSGTATSVLELIESFRRASGQPIPYEVVARRPGDDPATFADASLAAQELGWSAKRSIDEACADSWRWQSQNPRGYAS
ncbi:UDP-glucose 4-epimerase [Homoserinimonas aerilata]|uniref:UDP-glucose 4-epimerase n=1 Tax=Homoserinimonas aerilata TaxID=1162970 RepID=A0A542YKY7_9MICO|nr:UDP-glucose 4-epimerase GalE [Homoserinimonas aerilata]TQL48756.1 UDP-glucose 4-epimerase [Homoserinimonas aerilata]